MGDVNQDDIDKLLQESMGGGGAADPEPAPAPAAPDPALEGPASQDDIDALFASVAAGPAPAPAPAAAPAPAPAPAAAPAPEPAPAAAPAAEADLDGVANQDDIDALFSAIGGGDEPAPAAAPEPEPAPAAPAPAAADLDGVANQDDIDALFSSIGGEPEPAVAPEPEPAPAAPAPAPAAPVETPPAPAAAEGGGDDAFDMDELLRQVSEAAPPPPPERAPDPSPEAEVEAAGTKIFDEASAEAEAVAAMAAAPLPAPPQPAAFAPAPAPVPIPQFNPADMLANLPPPPQGVAGPSGPRREFSVLYGAGEVDSFANQINALLNSMSEKAHGYMQAWIAADSEAKELRARALAEERRRTSLESEKAALAAQLDDVRSKIAEVEGGKIASEESRRTLETTYQSKIRELESQISLRASEAEALKDELTRARNEATGVDIESRRARFEADRLKNEVESERMERLRMQRALENREKELQAMQAQAGGQASSLFIDELHRLVRRLESELEARASGAHEALKQLDRLEVAESMVPVSANLRAALMQALGQNPDADDALKSLGREAGGVKGAGAVAPEKTELVSFETAVSTYNLDGAVDIAGALLREARATPSLLMRKIYQCPALRRQEVMDHLQALARLLEGLRTIQEANDRARGSESGDAEVFYVHLFDFLHNLVKLKLINRMSGDMWRLFLDLRGRFSFVNSDRQWAEYRDKTLGDQSAKA